MLVCQFADLLLPPSKNMAGTLLTGVYSNATGTGLAGIKQLSSTINAPTAGAALTRIGHKCTDSISQCMMHKWGGVGGGCGGGGRR